MKNETGLKGRNSADLPSFQPLKIVKILGLGLHKRDIYGHSGEVGDMFQDTKFYTEIKHSYGTGNISLKTPEMAELPQKVKSRYFQFLNLPV